ncbi:MAG: hypothetical protein ABI612_11275 [Betaproteobacteria bacterium]
MFTNLETSDFKNSMKMRGDHEWNSLATASLRRNDRNIAIGTIAEALQVFAMRQPVPDDILVASLYTLAVQRVDFYAIALELVIAAEAADTSLVKASVADIEEVEEEFVAA